MKFLRKHAIAILVTAICLLLIGFGVYKKGESDMADRVMREQIRMEAEKERTRQNEFRKQQILELKEIIPHKQAEIQLAYNKLNEINGFEFLRTPQEKEQQLADQNKILNNLKSELNELEEKLKILENQIY